MARKTTRQKVTLKRRIREYSTNPVELSRQLKETVEMLEALVNDANDAIEQLRIVNGTVSPSVVMPQRDELEFAGSGVTLTTTAKRNVVTIDGGVSSATGVDGVDVTGTTALVVRGSRDIVSVTASSPTYNDWLPDAAFPTCDILLVDPTGSATVRGFQAPGADDTIAKYVWNVSTTQTFQVSHDSPGNSVATSRVLCPGETNWQCRECSGFFMLFDRSVNRWRILGRDWSDEIPSATGLDGVDVTGSSVFEIRGSRNIVSFSGAGPTYSDWLPDAAFPICDIFLFTPTGGVTVRGFEAPTADDTILKYVWNCSTTQTFQVTHDSPGNATATSRVLCPGAVNWQCRPLTGFVLLFERTANRWRLIGTIVDHGDLDGRSDDDHTLYILVAGTRPFTGSQSMGGNNLENTGYVELKDEFALSSGNTPAVGDMYVGTVNGIPHHRMGIDALWEHPAFVDYQEAADLSTSLPDVTINFANIDGKNLTDGVFFIEGTAFVVDNDSGSDSYYERRWWHVTFVSGAPTTATITQRLFDGVAFDMDSRGPVYGTVTVSGQVVTLTRNHIFGGGTARMLHVIRVTGLGGT